MSKKDTFVKEQPDVAKRLDDLEKTNKEQKKKIDSLEKELTEASEIISGLHEERSASDEEERQRLGFSCYKDSREFYRRDHLMNLGLVDLREVRKGFDMEKSIYYTEWLEANRKRVLAGKQRSDTTVGNYNQTTKRWEP